MARARGFEPLISSVTGRRLKPGWTMPALYKYFTFQLGVEGGSRTHDLGVMNATLSPTELPRHILIFNEFYFFVVRQFFYFPFFFLRRYFSSAFFRKNNLFWNMRPGIFSALSTLMLFKPAL